ncbi:zinc finger protein 800b isoform X2 [Electrophorus electricus]|nr:zinc finger protein 800b isoform X2 [Electrophorus electricus]
MDLSAEMRWSNEKSCQTDVLCHEPPKVCQPPVYSVELGDPPLLQRQQNTSKSGIHQIIECFRTGTTQLRHILLREVDTIFECKLCRSLFRGLPNLITHKEFYCLPRLPETEEHTGSDRQSLAVKDLLETLYPRPEGHVVRLEPMESNPNAVYQHVVNKDGGGPPSHDQSSAHSRESLRRPTPPHAEAKAGEEPQMDGESEDECSEDEEGQSEEQMEEADGDDGVVLDDDEDEDEESDSDSDSDDEEEEDDEEDEGDQEEGDGVRDLVITCCMCGKDFNTRRGVRRHCRKMHKQRLEELRKFTETRTVPISLLSVMKDRLTGQIHPPSTDGKRCPICAKTFATKANVRRHFDEVHRGLRRDLITPDIATKPGELDSASPRRGPASVRPKPLLPLPQYNLSTLKCLLCKRTYSTLARLKRHMRFVHKVTVRGCRGQDGGQDGAQDGGQGSPDDESRPERASPLMRRHKLALGFDFKQLFCKLCKRQFSSRENLAKHIELHTDNGSDIFIKFYRCPVCCYESRRKRDVLRHVTVVHKKNTAYLAKILPVLESRVVKKPAEVVLGDGTKRRHARGDVNGRKADGPGPSPPVTRKQSLFPRGTQSSDGPAHHDQDVQDGTEVRVTKNFSLHACDMCGRAFAKKVYLESHKRSHRNAAHGEARTAGVSTRSKSLL